MQILALINFTACIHGFFLSFLLLKKRGENREHRFLALLILVMSASMIGPIMGLTGYYKELPHLIRVSEPLALLFGPLLYYYISVLSENKLPKKYYLHLLPFILYTLYLIPFYSQSGEAKINLVEEQLKNNVPNIPMHLLRVIQVGVYIILSLLLIKKLEKKLKINFSDVDQFKLENSSFVLKSYLFVLLFGFFVYLLSLTTPLNFLIFNNITGLGISVLIYCLAYFTWDQPVFLIHRMEESSLALENLSPAGSEEEPVMHEKGRTSYYLNDTQYQKMALRLEKLLEKKEVYLDPEVTLAQLSEKLEILPYQTSEVISRKYKQTFFDLINNYRIAEIKKRLTDPHYDHFSILAIAMECGFNSKSSFNTAFKKFTGCTPSEFRRNKAADVSVFK